MFNNIGPVFLTVVGGIITLAMLAVVVSQKAQTSGVIQAGGSALGNIIANAVAPVTGNAPGGSFGSSGLTSLGPIA